MLHLKMEPGTPAAPMFTARIIGGTEAMAAFGLVRLCYPDIAVEAWRGHVGQLGAGRRRRRAGCIVVGDQRGCVHAACLFRVAPDPRAGRRLEVSYLSKAELPATAAADILLAFIDDLARREACTSIVIEDSDARIADDRVANWTAIGRDLAAHAFRPASVGFVKAVAPASLPS